MTLTHASFFSGVGGLDMGLERAGWSTVSFSEIDPYASAVLARHWPAVPNLGSIVDIAAGRSGDGQGAERPRLVGRGAGVHDRRDGRASGGDWRDATLWTGGFPCQDLSVAGKRRGMGTDTDRSDTRSGLAYAFLDLVERYRPPAIILENVPGLLSSHRGRDFYALQRRMAELGYVGAYRILDARYFGVPQRRRRVFIVALDARLGATEDDAAEVLSVGSRCDRHPATGGQAGPGAAASPVERPHGVVADGAESTRTIQAAFGHHGYTYGDQDVDGGLLQLGASPDPRGDRAPDGLAGRPHDRAGLAFRKATKAHHADDWERWEPADATDALTASGLTPRTDVAVVSGGEQSYHQRDRIHGDLAPALDAHAHSPGDAPMVAGTLDAGDADPLLPDGLDSHRYRCCGNGVVAPVSEFVGERLRVVVERLLRERAA